MITPEKRRSIRAFGDALVELPLDTQKRFHLACWQRWRDLVGYFWPRDDRFDLVVRLFEQGVTSLSRAEKKWLRAYYAELVRRSDEPRTGVFADDMSDVVRGAMVLAVEDSIRGDVEATSWSCLIAVEGWVFQLAWLPHQGYLPASIPAVTTWEPVFRLADIEAEWIDKTIHQLTAGADAIDCFNPLPAYFSLEPLAGALGLSWPLRAPAV